MFPATDLPLQSLIPVTMNHFSTLNRTVGTSAFCQDSKNLRPMSEEALFDPKPCHNPFNDLYKEIMRGTL